MADAPLTGDERPGVPLNAPPSEPIEPLGGGTAPVTTGFVADGDIYQPPVSARQEGYLKTPSTYGARVGSEVVAGSPTSWLMGAAERGQEQGASGFDRSIAAGPFLDSSAPLGAGYSGEGTYRTDPVIPTKPSPMLSAEEANKRYAPEGTTITNGPISEGLAQVIGRQKAAELQRNSVIERNAETHSWPVNFATGMATFMLDPINAATSFVPGLGEATTAAALGRAGLSGVSARMATRAIAGATAMGAQQVPLSILEYGLGTEQASDYGIRDAMFSVAMGAALGAAFHAGFGGLRELGVLRPDHIMAPPIVPGTPEAPAPTGAPPRPPLPDSSLLGSHAETLEATFAGADYHGEPANLAEHGFPPDAIAALHADGLADADGNMSREQWEAWREERAMRLPEAPEPTPVPAPEPAPPEAAEVLAMPAHDRIDMIKTAVAETLDGRPVDVTPVVDAAAARTPTTQLIRRGGDEFEAFREAHNLGPNDHLFDIEQNGNVIGTAHIHYDAATHTGRIMSVGVHGEANALGAKAVLELRRQLQAEFPEMTHISGERLSGANRGRQLLTRSRTTPAEVAAHQADLARNGHVQGIPDTELRETTQQIYPEERPPEPKEAAKPEVPKAKEEEKPTPAPEKNPPVIPKPPTPEAPEPVTVSGPKLIYNGQEIEPRELMRQISEAETFAIDHSRSASRARTATARAAQREAMDNQRVVARAKRAALDRWQGEYPEEAARIFGEHEGDVVPPAVPTAPSAGMSLVETIHTRDKHPLYVITMPAERVDRARFQELRAAAKEGGGYWSSFKGTGAVPGWQFKDRAAAENFMRQQGGEPGGVAAAPRVEPTPAPAEAAPPSTRPATYGASNKLVTTADAEAIRARLRAKAAQLRTGIDPEMMLDGARLAVYHIEAGTRAFAAFAHEMVADLGEEFRPYLRSWYESARHWPGVDATGMSTHAEVDAELARTVTAPAGELDAAEADRLLDAHEGEPAVEAIKAKLTAGETAPEIAADGEMPFTAPEVQGIADALDRRGELEADDAVQDTVPVRDEGAGAQDVQRTEALGEDGRAPATEGGGGGEDAVRPAGLEAAEQVGQPAPGGPAGGGGARPSDADRLPDTDEGPEPRATGRPPAPDALVQGANFTIEPGSLAEARGAISKARDNIRAIELAKQLIEEDRPATKAEQAILVRYVGWGGTARAFEHAELGPRLRELLTEEEYRTARQSTQYAHYTAEGVVRAMWGAMERLGFKGGSVFEPGMGIGHFLGMMPPGLAERSTYQGIERDSISADIAKLLYPQSGIRKADFFKTPIPDSHFDLAIGNPPFSDLVVKEDAKYAARGFMLHDYFFAKSIDSVRPGGVLGFVTSAGTMNKLDSAARDYLAERAEFLGGVRLNSGAFEEGAGTKVTTDILFFQRRPEGRIELGEDKPAWTETVQRTMPDRQGNPYTGNVSRYFSEHPEQVLGEEGFTDQLQASPRYAVQPIAGRDFAADLHEALGRLPENVVTEPATPEQRATLDFASGQRKDGSFYLADGKLMQYRDGAGREVPRRSAGSGFTAGEIERIEHLIPMRDALRDVFAADLKRDAAAGDAARVALNTHYDAFVAKFGPVNKAEYQYRRPTLVQQETARLEAREDARSMGEPWNDGDFDPEPMLQTKKSITQIAKARQTAREAAQAAGRTFNEGAFDPADMADITYERLPNIKPFMGDPESYRLRSIEDYNAATGEAAKRDIFHENILARRPEPQIRSADDGVLWSLNEHGRLDLDAIAAKMGRGRDDLIHELGDAIYKVPGTRDAYQTREEYLSGDVVSKLDQARAAAEHDPEVRRNVAALEAAVPAPLPPSEISMVIGMPWIPREVVQRFAAEHLDIGPAQIVHSPGIGTWSVIEPRNTNHPGTAAWSTPERGAYELLSDAMNRTPPRIYVRVDRDKPPQFDPVATQAAQDKVDAIKAAFADWATADPERADGLAQLYNDKLNRTVLRQYDGSYLTTPGVAADWSWRPHQQRVVARIVQDGNTYMAHAVGAGKTSAMIGAGMEMRRLGLVKKPLYVVPNHMLGQFAKEFYEQYPTARIAVADEARFQTGRRKQFIANVAQDDLDAVIITHSSFGKIPVGEEFQQHLIQEQMDMLQEAMENLKEQGGDRFTMKRLENQKEKLEQKLSARNAGGQDETLNFGEMGTDFLFVDEAHQFRKLAFSTRQGNLKGISPEGSQMAWDLYTKVRYLDDQRPGRSAVFASGTPITNTMGELYSLSRFMQPEALKERGIGHFDSWAQAFGDTKTQLEENAAGGYQPVTRFNQFVNLPELYKMVGEVMDIVTANQLEQYVTLPKVAGGARELHMAPRTDILDAYQRELGKRMEAIKERKGPPSKGDDIMLSVINDGRHAAIDPRFVEETQSDPNSKLNMMVRNVVRIYHETADHEFFDPKDDYKTSLGRGPAAQMIFANMGVNGRGPMGFSSYQWIREALRREGIPAKDIAFIGDYEGTLRRQALFNDVNEGKVRILIGSVQKMGTGVNAQKRLVAVHNEDPLWFPADDTQRNGRILRQGNTNPEIQIHDYTTKGTYDSAMWKMMGNKARFIEQFFRGDPELRTMEDLGEASMYEQASAMSTTDERMITLTQLRQDLDKAKRRQSAYDRDQYSLRTNLKSEETRAQFHADQGARLQEDIAQRRDTRGDAFRMTVAGTEYATRKEAADALGKTLAETEPGMGKGASATVGQIGGFPLVVSRDAIGFSHDLRLSDGRTLGLRGNREEPAGLIASAEARLRNLENDVSYAAVQRADALKQAANIRPNIGKPFGEAGEVPRLTKAVADLEEEMRPRTEEELAAMKAVAPAGPEGEPAADTEMADAERNLNTIASDLTPEERAEIDATATAVARADDRAKSIEEAGNCLKGAG